MAIEGSVVLCYSALPGPDHVYLNGHLRSTLGGSTFAFLTGYCELLEIFLASGSALSRGIDIHACVEWHRYLERWLELGVMGFS